jgi:DNA-directed RNA polymerase specialized sigma24 family protein
LKPHYQCAIAVFVHVAFLIMMRKVQGRIRFRERQVLLLTAIDGLSHAQAAAVIGIRPQSVTKYLYRLRSRLRVQEKE